MSAIAGFANDVIEKNVAAGERPVSGWERGPWSRYSDVRVTAVTLVEERSDWLIAAHKKLARLACLNDDWDSYGAESPNQKSIEAARGVLDVLADVDFEPTSIDPSAEGGVCLSFQLGDRYGDIECFNSGEVLAVTSRGGLDTTVWEINAVEPTHRNALIRNALRRIRAFVAH
jgi:hypothetical protein